MNNLFIYSIQASLALILFYLIYWLLLKKETYFIANRLYLITTVVIAIILPFFPIHYTVFIEYGLNDTNLFRTIGHSFKEIQPYTGEGFKQSISFGYTQAIVIVYLTGVTLLFLRLLIQASRLIFERFSNKTKTIQGLLVVETKKYDLPFSFFNIVFINPKYINQNDLPEILAHETVHIREKHWVDLLIIELLTVIFWFNPIIWFFEHSIKLNHEFLADQGILSKGIHLGKYQALLINQLMGMQIIGITNNLNYSINSNRLKMMTKQKTPKIKAIKLVWSLPVLAFLLFAFAKPDYQISKYQKTQDASEYAPQQKATLLSGKVTDENGDALAGVSIIRKGTNRGTTSDHGGNFKIELAEKSSLVFTYVGKKTLFFTAEELIKMQGDDKNITIRMPETAILLSPEILNAQPTTPASDFNTADTPPPPPPPPPSELNKPKDVSPPPPKPKRGDEKEVFYVVEELPQYPGGYKALSDYISKSQEKLAKEKGISGSAKVSFTINKNGEATSIRILEKDNELAAKGAASIIMNMEKWNPGRQRGKAVEVNYILPCKF